MGPTHSPSPHSLDPSQWVARYGDVLFRYAVVRVGRRETAEDLVQETLLAGLGAQERFAGESSEETWLIAILRRKIVDHFRKQGRRREVSAEEPAGPASSPFDSHGHWSRLPARWPRNPSETLEDAEFRKVFEECLSKLPASLGNAFCLRELDGEDTEKICKALEITATNLGVRLYRARVALRRCLEMNWFTDPSD